MTGGVRISRFERSNHRVERANLFLLDAQTRRSEVAVAADEICGQAMGFVLGLMRVHCALESTGNRFRRGKRRGEEITHPKFVPLKRRLQRWVLVDKNDCDAFVDRTRHLQQLWKVFDLLDAHD